METISYKKIHDIYELSRSDRNDVVVIKHGDHETWWSSQIQHYIKTFNGMDEWRRKFGIVTKKQFEKGIKIPTKHYSYFEHLCFDKNDLIKIDGKGLKYCERSFDVKRNPNFNLETQVYLISYFNKFNKYDVKSMYSCFNVLKPIYVIFTKIASQKQELIKTLMSWKCAEYGAVVNVKEYRENDHYREFDIYNISLNNIV
jgi:hypothetical protein